ncbi:MAG: hypothetical protein J2P24_00425 [Streptosporangiales bacterium]|nr:hypothetical protein [Streptosporangiales bacterium]
MSAVAYWLIAAIVIVLVVLVVWYFTPGFIAVAWLLGLVAVAVVGNTIRVRARR